MDPVEERSSVTERKSKTLPFYNARPGLAGQPGSPRVALAWRHHARSLAHWSLVGMGQEVTRGTRLVSRRAQKPRVISYNYNSGVLRNNLLNFKIDAKEFFLWEILWFTTFESRLTWNTTASVDLWDSLCKCRQIRAVGVKSRPTKLSDPSPSIQGLDVTKVMPPASRVTRPPVPGRWVDGFPPQRCSPLEGDVFPLEFLNTRIFLHLGTLNIWKSGFILHLEWENIPWNRKKYTHFGPFPRIF